MPVMPPPAARDLLLEIAHCPVVELCKSGAAHPCSGVVSVQSDVPLPAHQVPEPWAGRLDLAVVLFLSSNPSIGEEDYPRWEDDGPRMIEYFQSRFDGGPGQIRDGIYPPLPGGGWDRRWVRFWAAVKSRTAELADAPVPGLDYALTEVVHCKSTKEQGVAAARPYCSDRYLKRTVGAAQNAAALVVYGAHAVASANELIGTTLRTDRRYDRVLGPRGGPLHVLFLDHPAGFGKIKKISAAVGPELVADIRNDVAAARQARR